MSEPMESRVKAKFLESLSREELPEDIRVVYQVAGGMPHERVEHEFVLTGGGRAKVRMADALRGRALQEASADLDRDEVRHLLAKIGVSLDELVPRSEARFLPDSLVGSITITAGGEKATFFFLADEDQRVYREKERLPDEERSLARDRVAASALTRTMDSINAVSERLLTGEKEEGNE